MEEAVNWSNELVRRELDLSLPAQGPTQILDLGCGVGSSLFHLAAIHRGDARFWGVSISEVQIELARQFANQEDGGQRCEFLCGDFLDLPEMPEMHFAYAIEAFLHATSPSRFFESVGSALGPGARLVLIDDVLSERGAKTGLSRKEQGWLDEFRSGWLAGSLVSVESARTHAARAGLRLLSSENLSMDMRLGRPRDKLIGLMRRVAAPYMRKSTYLRSLSGGYAKQQCLKNGLVEYRKLVFEA